MRHLAGGVVLVQYGHDLAQHGAELRGGHVAVLLQLRHEAHQGGRSAGVVAALALELRTQQGQGDLTWPKPED